MGHACIPQDGHCLASFEVTPPLPEKVSFSAAKQNENSPLKTGCARPLLKKKFRPIFSFCFGCFCWRFCHADVDSREQQAILLKKVENFRPKLRVSCFSGEKFGTVLSRRSRLSRASRAPSRLIRPRSIDCDAGPKQTTVSRLRLSRLLANSFFEHRQNKLFQKEKVRHLVLSTPHKKPIAGFSFFD